MKPTPSYAEGRKAYNCGKALSECPYARGTTQHGMWIAGWNDAVQTQFQRKSTK
jgi:ribosome modulation factor